MIRLSAAALLAVLMLLSATPGEAHRAPAPDGPAPAGVSIPSLTHGQMRVISDNLSAIRALADVRIGFDMTTWRLQDYLNLQSFACLWGVVPGSVTDEESPFNECAHAYLAAARALLLHLREAPRADHGAVDALIARIEREMMDNGVSLSLCRYSDEPFNTNVVVFPRWRGVASHPPTLAVAAVMLAAGAGLGWGLWPRRRPDPRSAP